MRKWFRIAPWFLLVVAVGGIVWWALIPQEPVYKGRRLSAWMRDTQADDTEIQNKARDAIQAIGTNGLPSLISMLQYRDSPLKIKFRKLAERQHWIKFDFDQALYARERAVEACEFLGPQAKPAIPALAELLQNPINGGYAGMVLAGMGPEGVLPLINGVTNTNASVRYNATMALSGVGNFRRQRNLTSEQISAFNKEAEDVLPVLMSILTNKTDPVRPNAALALGALGKRADIVVPALVLVLQDTNDIDSASDAAIGLGAFGGEGESAVPALVAALNSPSSHLRAMALKSLKKIDPEAAVKAGVK